MHPDTSIYILGAQCTGKTTLVNALFDAIQYQHKDIVLRRITEVARTVLLIHNFTRDDITSSPSKALKLQKLILSAQFAAETQQSYMPVLSDRSGIDPIIYATIYGPPHGRESLESTRQWQILRSRMMNSLVILCPPHQEWLTDDGTRLVASSWKDWQETHTTFCQVLAENSIPFVALPDHLLELQDRVDFVFREWTTAFPRVITNTPSVSRGLSDQPNQQLVGDASNS